MHGKAVAVQCFVWDEFVSVVDYIPLRLFWTCRISPMLVFLDLLPSSCAIKLPLTTPRPTHHPPRLQLNDWYKFIVSYRHRINIAIVNSQSFYSLYCSYSWVNIQNCWQLYVWRLTEVTSRDLLFVNSFSLRFRFFISNMRTHSLICPSRKCWFSRV